MRHLIKAMKTGRPLMIHPSIAKSHIDRFQALEVTTDTKASEVSEILKMMFGEQPKMEIVGTDWRTNPVTQITWGLKYIDERYEYPCAAWSKSKRSNWY